MFTEHVDKREAAGVAAGALYPRDTRGPAMSLLMEVIGVERTAVTRVLRTPKMRSCRLATVANQQYARLTTASRRGKSPRRDDPTANVRNPVTLEKDKYPRHALPVTTL